MAAGIPPGMFGRRTFGRQFKRAGSFLRDSRGATAMEYGLLIALIAIGLIGTLKALNMGDRVYRPIAVIINAQIDN